MTASAPEISVIIPVHNGEKFLGESVESVLAQSAPPGQIVIVDDGSIDGSAAVAARFGTAVRCVHQDHRGPSAARNHGLAATTGSLVAFLDADDIWPSGWLATARATLEPGMDLALGLVKCLRPDGLNAYHPVDPAFHSFNIGGALFRRSAFDRVGRFDETLRLGEDIDWFLRAREKNLPIQLINEVALHYRRHEDSMTRDKSAGNAGLMAALKNSLDRRRLMEQIATDLPALAGWKSGT